MAGALVYTCKRSCPCVCCCEKTCLESYEQANRRDVKATKYAAQGVARNGPVVVTQPPQQVVVAQAPAQQVVYMQQPPMVVAPPGQ